jgi:predicted anti-sigma-YlaC factor YlaD
MGDALEAGVAAESRNGFDEHMQECSPCRNYLEQLRLTREALRELPRTTSATSPIKDRLIERFREELKGH